MEEQPRETDTTTDPAAPTPPGAGSYPAWVMLPPMPGSCPVCSGDHAPEVPHNPYSLYWQVVFSGQHDRYPTWVDAMAHCSPARQAAVARALADRGISAGDEYRASLAVAAARRGAHQEEERRGTGG